MATNASILQHATVESPIDVAHGMRTALTVHRKSLWSQISEICRLRLGPGKLQPEEYYYYRLYDDEQFSYEDKRRFLGKKCWNRVYKRCNANSWWSIAHDKLIFYTLLRGQDLPMPANRALYHPFRRMNDVPTLASAEELAVFLRRDMVYPAFAKPIAGIRSTGVAVIRGYDQASDSLILHDGQAVQVDRYIEEIDRYRREGYLFQELLAPHPDLARLCGDRLSTVRLIVGIDHEQPHLMHALWKIPVGSNPADNFWRTGNLLAALDPGTGAVGRIIRGAGPDQAEIERHPDTGERLEAVILPAWRSVVDLCLTAAAMLPELKLQAWDVALTDRGPVLIEVNIGGDFNLPQLALQAGIMNPDFRDFIDRATDMGGETVPDHTV